MRWVKFYLTKRKNKRLNIYKTFFFIMLFAIFLDLYHTEIFLIISLVAFFNIKRTFKRSRTSNTGYQKLNTKPRMRLFKIEIRTIFITFYSVIFYFHPTNHLFFIILNETTVLNFLRSNNENLRGTFIYYVTL